MKNDDLINKLSPVDPVGDDRVDLEARALRDLPARIVAGEFGPSRVVRMPRRRLAVGVAAAVIAVGVAVPLFLLSPLGSDRTTPATGWISAGSLDALRAARIVYIPEAKAFVVALPGEEPFALSSVSPHLGETLLFCQTSDWFFDPQHGDQYDLQGNYELGPAPAGMNPVALQVVDGDVQLDPSRVSDGAPRGAPGTDDQPDGPFCDQGSVPVAPGIVAAPPQVSLDAITIRAPDPGARISSPVRIAGTANVFEAVVHYEILDQHHHVIAQGTTSADCGTGCRGTYSATVPFTVDQEQPGTVRVFGVSEMDATPQDLIEMPVTLVPGPLAPIEVTQPFPGESVPSPFTVSGSADVFEATVSYELLDQNGQVLAQGTTMATCGSGCRGTYSVRIRYSVTVPQTGTLRVFEVSAKDGSTVNVVEFPVALSP